MSATSSPKRSKRYSLPVLPSNNTLRVREGSVPPKVSLEQLQVESKEEEKRRVAIAAVQKKWWKLDTFEWDVLVVGTAAKLLLFPAYRSTDFEVHRNWMAITNSLPISKWYYENTSEWTLDYPPFFAYFEYILSIPASFIDSKMVDVKNLGYDAWSVIAYQRTTVIITELVMALALRSFIAGSFQPRIQRIISASLFLHPGFLIVDHIHFQYNGFMFGILLWSLLMVRNDKKLLGGILFAVLLNFKHIYMYIAPPYFIYLLRAYCLTPNYSINFQNFMTLAQSVLLVFAVSFGPFALMGQIPQVLSRLFPFTRGLNHAYWAPNVWAVVTAVDRVLLQLVKMFGLQLKVEQSGVESTSRGLVGDTSFAVLPNIKPIHTFAITIILQSIFLIKLWRNPNYKSFVAAVTLCGYVSFLFGWHVHEKAILLVLVPLSLIAGERHAYFRTFTLASVAGIFSLFPLLFTPAETLVKIVYSVIWCAMVLPPLQKQLYQFPTTLPQVLLDYLERAYLWGFVILQAFSTLYPIITTRYFQSSKGDLAKLEFLPLMITSIYCAIGVIWAFLRLSFLYLREKY